MISEGLGVSSEQAFDMFYKSHVYTMLKDPKFGLQIMSDECIYDEFISELRDSGIGA